MTRLALILAANEFADPRISNLRYAEHDAQVLAGVLRESGCFATVKTLVGAALRKEVALATAREFALRLAAEGGGLLKIFYAGHGYHHQGKDLLLCPAAQLDELDEFDHAISADRLKAVTAQPGVDRLLVTDSCRTNLRADLRDTAPQGYDLGLRNLVAAADTAGRVGAWAMLAACSQGEQASELEELEHGAFCHAYVETLRQARAEGREVRLDDALMASVQQRLASVLLQYRRSGQQTPWRQHGGEPPIILPGRRVSAETTAAIPEPPAPELEHFALDREDAETVEPVRLTVRARNGGGPADFGGITVQVREAFRPGAEVDVSVEAPTANGEQKVWWQGDALGGGGGDRVARYLQIEPTWDHWEEGGSREVTVAFTFRHPGTYRLFAKMYLHRGGTNRMHPGGRLHSDHQHEGTIPLGSVQVRPGRGISKSANRWRNSLGMEFVPVPVSADGSRKAQFCIWPTRVRDYAAYAEANPGVAGEWTNPGFEQGDTHPVVNVSWEEAVAFCAWLTEREHRSGILAADEGYRLPTDAEWSHAAGIGEAEACLDGDTSPAALSGRIRPGQHPRAFPWGPDWPPPRGFGNYSPELDVDSHSKTSPVGTFPANADGLFDLAGNVWEWCQDPVAPKSVERPLRGGSWVCVIPDFLLTSCRLRFPSDFRDVNYGFRIVLVRGHASQFSTSPLSTKAKV